MTTSSLAESILAGRYQPDDTFLHRLSVGRKLLLAATMVVLASSGNFHVLGTLAVVVLVAWKLTAIPFALLGRLIRSFRWFLLILGFFPVFFTPGRPIEALSFLPFVISWEGVFYGLQASSKLLVMFMISFLLMRTTPAMDLMRTLKKLIVIRSPRWRRAVEDFFHVGVMAVQLIPLLCVEAERFMLSKLNEQSKEDISRFQKAWRVGLLLAPLVAHVLKEQDRFAAALAHENAGTE
jgi:energy-coupling factor transporter transmembrane protein EcfT